MITSPSAHRRQFLQTAATGAFLATAHAAETPAKAIAAIVTEFRPNSHAEMLAGRWLEGFELDGKSERPQSRLVSLYTDQVPANDIGRKLAEKHGVSIYTSVRKALCRGGEKFAVDGVLLIGEHGSYPSNEKGQQLYPRRQFFEEVVQVIRDSGRSVPVFCDKHLSYSWDNAKWMYDRAAELKMPLMAGSSAPGAWRRPARELTAGSVIEEALMTCYGGLERSGFHGLECLQSLMERRSGGETGVAAVICLEGDAIWQAAQAGRWSRPLLDAALAVAVPKSVKKGKPEDNCKKPVAYIIEYNDGRRATLLFVGEHVPQYLFAARLTGKAEPWAVHFVLQLGRPFGHFTPLARGIDRMFLTGRPSWPVERTLLTTGILDAALTSRFQGHKRLATPHLAIRYVPAPAWQTPPPPQTGPRLPA